MSDWVSTAGPEFNPTVSFVSVVIDEDNNVRLVRNVPNMMETRSVIGLDAHPVELLWEMNLSPFPLDLQTENVVGNQERKAWRRQERGLTVVQVGEATRPAGKDGRYFSGDKARTLLMSIQDEHDDFRAVVAPKSVESDVIDIMGKIGIQDPKTMHFGEEGSRNDFAGESVGAVLGCIDPGDDMVLNLLAERGLEARPERSNEDCESCTGLGCDDCLGSGKKRARGRGFVGPDADTAARFLASVRENHVAQALGRWARNPADPKDKAIVFVWTDALPDRFPDEKSIGVQNMLTWKRRLVLRFLLENPGSTAKEIKDLANQRIPDDTVSKPTVRRTLDAYEEAGKVSVEKGEGYWGGDAFYPEDLNLAIIE